MRRFNESYVITDGKGSFYYRGSWSPIFRPSGEKVAKGYTTVDGAREAAKRAGLESFNVELI